MRRAQDETGEAKIFSANITADDHHEMCARADYILETFAENAHHVAFLVDGYVGGPWIVSSCCSICKAFDIKVSINSAYCPTRSTANSVQSMMPISSAPTLQQPKCLRLRCLSNPPWRSSQLQYLLHPNGL